MPSQRNIQSLDEVRQKVEKSTAMFFVDYAGLTHQQLEEARRELAKNESEIAVVKNTLMAIALEKCLPAGRQVDAKERLQGPHATLFSYSDPIATAKVLSAFVKKYGLPKIKFGLFEGELIDEAMIGKLSTLPSKEILVAKLLGTLNAPISNFVYGLNANIVKLAQLLKAIEEKKGAAGN
ncbi:MAG TPA: 50S ribosomal protein L10 [Patescibacteria group bacterium]|nr:50S ribosomal protein L10 [Patescibacteria group bacterium]